MIYKVKEKTLNFIGSDSGFGDNNNSAYIEDGKKFILIDCGFTVFNKIKKFNFNKYESMNVIITHLHNDHAGSLSQFILYMWYVFGKKVNVVSMCKDIEKYLEITGTPKEAFEIEKENSYIKFIKTEHVKEIDAYGFKISINNKKIIYTGDTNTIEPFIPYINDADELYIDVSKNGGVHIKIDNVMEYLRKIAEVGTKVYLMHVDDKSYMHEKCQKLLNIV